MTDTRLNEAHAEILRLRARVAKLEALVEAQAKVIGAADEALESLENHHEEYERFRRLAAYDAAKAELEKLR